MNPIENLPNNQPDPIASNKENLNMFRKLSDQDPQFSEFLEAYQKGEWQQSKDLLDGLIVRHPDAALLQSYNRDLEIQLSLREISKKHTTENKKKSIRRTANISIFTVALILFIIVVLGGVFILIGNYRGVRRAQQNQEQMAALVVQANQLLLSGQPAPALTIIEKIRGIDPQYPQLTELKTAADLLSGQEQQYHDAIALINAGKYEDAKKILEEIQKAQPGLWDVPRQLTLVENKIAIASLFADAQSAYSKEDWEQVIKDYEGALAIDPKLDDPVMKEQLLNGYLRSIIKMLESNTTTIQDIERAEEYYRKAVAMIPQSRTYLNQRENLQEVSSSLLVLKYSQTAYQMLQDSNQTIDSIGKAVSYLSRASNLSPNDQQLQTDLSNAQLYQIGFQYFLDMNWGPAIDNLSRLVTIQKDYAGGKANILLYEAYAARGRQYYSVGLYLDARRNFEAAEIIAWERPDNPFKLFDIQIWLGNTIGKLRDYTNAVSYYQYAFTTINIYPHLVASSDFAQLFNAAEALATEGSTQAAYEKYGEALTHIQDVYSTTTVKIEDGGCLAFFADDNKSTIYAVQMVNNLLKNVTVTFSQDLLVPTIVK